MKNLKQSIKAWIDQPNFDDFDDVQNSFYIQVVVLIMIFSATAICIAYALINNWRYVLLIAVDIVVNGVVLWMARRKFLKPANILFLVFTLGFLIYCILASGSIHSVVSVLYPLVLIFASLLLDRKHFVAYASLCIVSVGLIVSAENLHLTPPYVPDPPHFALFFAFSLIILGIAVLVRFITESLQSNLRKTRQHEQELEIQKEILDRVGQAVVAGLPDDTIFYWNKAASDYYGWQAGEVLGKKYREIIPVSSPAGPGLETDSALQPGNVWSGELLIQKRDGTLLPTINTVSPLHDREGKMSGWVGIAADISERKKVEAALQESETKFHSFFDHSQDAMFLANEDGLLIEMNTAAENLFELSRGETLGRAIWDVQASRLPEARKKELSVDAIRRNVVDVLRTGQAPWLNRMVEGQIQRLNGEILYIQQMSFCVPHAQQFRIASIIRNVTEDKKAEAFRVQAETELRTQAMRQRLLDFNRELLATVDMVEIFQVIRKIAADLLPHEVFHPYWLDEQADVFVPADKPYQKRVSDLFDPKWKIPLSKGIMGDVAQKQQAECVNNAHLDPRSVYPPGVREKIAQEHGIFLPIHEQGKVIGVLVLLRRTLPAFSQEEFELAQLFISQAELALSTARMFANLEQLVAERTAQLAASEERYRLISAVSSDYMFSSRLNEQGQFSLDWVAGAFESITGYNFDEYVARGGWVAALHPDDLEQDARDMAALRANQPVTTEVRMIAKSGQVRWARVYAHPVWSVEKKQLFGIYGAVQDITTHKQAEVREEYRRKMLEKVVNLGKKIAGITSLRECLLEIHDSIQQGLGFDRVGIFLYDAVKRLVEGTFGTDVNGNLEDNSAYAEGITQGDAWDMALKNSNGIYLIDDLGQKSSPKPLKPKMRGVKEHLTVSAWAGDVPVALITADNLITQSKMTDEQIEALQLFGGYVGLAIQNARWNEELEKRVEIRTAELESANLELESLSYTIGHDLRSPIRAIVAYSRLLMEDLAERLEPGEQNKLIMVNQVSMRMGRMVDEFLSFLRLGRSAIRRHPIDTQELVRSVVAKLRDGIPGRSLNMTVLPMPGCVADASLLDDVFTHLISNALKFTASRNPASIEIGAIEDQGQMCYFVRDNGVGFDMQYANKLFGVFQRLHHDDEFEGVGIGLAIVQRIIQRHGGRIWAHSEVGQGATFYFTLGQVLPQPA